MVVELEPSDLEEARKLFEAAENLPKATQEFRKRTEAIGKLHAKHKQAVEQHVARLRAAEDAKARAHEAVRVARTAMDTIRARFVARELVVALEQAEARGRELELEHRDARGRAAAWRRARSDLAKRHDLEPEVKAARFRELKQALDEAEAAAAQAGEKIRAQERAIEEAAQAIEQAVEAIFQLAFEAPPAAEGGPRG